MTDAGQFRRVCDMTEDELAAMIASVEPAQPYQSSPKPPDVKKMN